ncbi:MAG: S-layer homology domain-containing protein [Anaerovoracaceae bacterium]|jgi:hypothetical protein
MQLLNIKTKIRKKVIKQAIIVLVFILSMSSLCFGFSDVEENHQAFNDIKTLTDAGYLSGYPDGTFRPEGTITRAEFVRLTNQVLGYSGQNVSNIFSDVSKSDWFYEEVLTSLQEGYIIGYTDGTFRPNGNITREEVCVIIDNILNLSDRGSTDLIENVVISDKVSPWAKDSVNRVTALGLMYLKNNGVFRATEKATRAEVSSAYAILLSLKNTEEQQPEQKNGDVLKGGTTIEPEVRESINNVLSIIRNEILVSSKLTSIQKTTVKTINDALDDYLSTGDKAKLIQNKDKIKASYYSLSLADQSALEKEIRRCIPVTDLYNIRDYLF